MKHPGQYQDRSGGADKEDIESLRRRGLRRFRLAGLQAFPAISLYSLVTRFCSSSAELNIVV